VLNARTKWLFGISLLAPASVIASRLYAAVEKRKALQEGALGIWIDPGITPKLIFIVGSLAFVLAIVSTIVDFRRCQHY
jgi:hypothetical protein